jgi:hypothetical protein
MIVHPLNWVESTCICIENKDVSFMELQNLFAAHSSPLTKDYCSNHGLNKYISVISYSFRYSLILNDNTFSETLAELIKLI